jgi:aryl-phospho-beta-D-glucosidase BglC (GH1 family)
VRTHEFITWHSEASSGTGSSFSEIKVVKQGKQTAMGIFGDLKRAIGSDSIVAAAPAAPVGAPSNERSIYQSRKNFGVNFGSLFVLEKYIFDGMYIDGAEAELDAIENNVKKYGVDQTRTKMEDHWQNYCSDDDWKWLNERGIQSVRIPIGYWTVNGGSFAKDTHFEKIAAVYSNAWEILKKNYIEKAKQFNISILVDLHALPKGANTGDHSGEKFSKAGFWDDNHAIDLAVQVCSFIAKDLRHYDNISGIQIVNESVFDNHPSGQKKYYTKAINSIRKEDPAVPVVISDGWWPEQWVDFLDKSSQSNIGSLGVIIDDHVYRCFSNDDKGKRVESIIEDLNPSVLPNDCSNKADFLIGEYSCVLDTQSWEKSSGCDRDHQVRCYGNKQAEIFVRKAKAGYYFWTYKFQYGDGGEWGLVPMMNKGCIPSRCTAPPSQSQQDFDSALNEHYEQHKNYWQSQNANEKYEFWRYKEGFTTGWADAVEFAKLDNSRIGRVVAWTYSRKGEHIQARGGSGFLWQWDSGYSEALQAFDSKFS